ncbi:hypothetical protein ACFSO7_23520 [Bacillus sp. CGMCC 1.16607]|uniref:hypothetical protein n=1 Tax=Bacillus sp. CGMCC 1.16607 TaxID=3351842 RepID=UPI003638F930
MVFWSTFISTKTREKDFNYYNPVDQEELDGYVESLLNYHTEEIENNRLRKFFNDLRKVYGYLHTSDDGSYQFFIKIDEVLLDGGGLTGSLLMMADTENKNNPYEETRYVLNGGTDGHMVEFFTTVNGKKTKLKGNFHESATGFDLSFWATNRKLLFHAVTEEEYKQKYEEFKTKAQSF